MLRVKVIGVVLDLLVLVDSLGLYMSLTWLDVRETAAVRGRRRGRGRGRRRVPSLLSGAAHFPPCSGPLASRSFFLSPSRHSVLVAFPPLRCPPSYCKFAANGTKLASFPSGLFPLKL